MNESVLTWIKFQNGNVFVLQYQTDWICYWSINISCQVYNILMLTSKWPMSIFDLSLETLTQGQPWTVQFMRISIILKILKLTEQLSDEPGSEVFRLLQHVSVFASLTQSKIQSSNVIGHGYLKHVKSRQITRYILLF